MLKVRQVVISELTNNPSQTGVSFVGNYVCVALYCRICRWYGLLIDYVIIQVMAHAWRVLHTARIIQVRHVLRGHST